MNFLVAPPLSENPQDTSYIQSENVGDAKPTLLWKATFFQELEKASSGGAITSCPAPDGNLDYRTILESSEKAPDESNLPAASKCFIKNFRGRTIALGIYNNAASPMEHAYSASVEEILDRDAELYDKDGTLGDTMLGKEINWRKEVFSLIGNRPCHCSFRL